MIDWLDTPGNTQIPSIIPLFLNLLILLLREYYTRMENKGGHCATFSDSSLSLEEISSVSIYKRSDPRLVDTSFNPSFESIKEAIVFHNLKYIGVPYSIKSIFKV